jgi:acyl-CoA dehydrogenase
MINLELNAKHQETYNNLMQVAEHMMRPYSRKYDKEEHAYPREMEEVAKLIAGGRRAAAKKDHAENSACNQCRGHTRAG